MKNLAYLKKAKKKAIDEEMTINKELEKRKYRWIELSILGITACVILYTQSTNPIFVSISLVFFTLITAFESLGLGVVEGHFKSFGNKNWWFNLCFYKATLVDILLLFGAIVFLILSVF